MGWFKMMIALMLWGVAIDNMNPPSWVTLMGIAAILTGFVAHSDK